MRVDLTPRGRLAVTAPFEWKDALKRIPGARWDAAAKAWSYPATIHAIRNLKRDLPALDGAAEAFAPVLELRARAHAAMRSDGHDLPAPARTRREPWAHQRRGFTMLRTMPAAFLQWDMGSGKTKPVIDAVANMEGTPRALIVCPLNVIPVWPREFAKNQGNAVIVSPGGTRAEIERYVRRMTVKDKTEAAARAVRAGRDRRPVAVVVNYDTVYREPFASWCVKTPWDMIVLDESHRIKSPTGKRSRFLRSLGPLAPQRYCLTGTPMPHGPLDLFAQYHFLDPSIFGHSYVQFRARYAVLSGPNKNWIDGYKNLDELRAKMAEIADRVELDDVVELPAGQHEATPVTMASDQSKAYAEMEAVFITQVQDGTVTASNVLTKLLRLQQIACGFAKDEGGEIRRFKSNPKADALIDILTDWPADEPAVVFCRFHADLDAIRACAEKVNRPAFELSGRPGGQGMSDWQVARGGEVLAVQIDAGSEGVDLTRTRLGIYYSTGFSLGNYMQSQRRIRRPGQDRGVLYLHLPAAGTVDEYVYDCLTAKQDVVDGVLAVFKGRGAGGQS